MLQKDIFLSNEGNKYLERNKAVYLNEGNLEGNELFMACDKYIKDDFRILEIGCCNGINLNYYSKTKSVELYGIDPSDEAIEMGKSQYPKINLNVGTADKLDFEDGYFDMVIFGFCLYLVDRNLLFKSISEADRVLKNKGFLCIVDFDVNIPKKNAYRHFKNVYSYKLDYSKLFTCYPEYTLIEKFTKKNEKEPFFENVENRVANWVLYKDYEQSYV